MRYLLTSFIAIFLSFHIEGQHITEFNRLFNEPADSGRWALTLSLNGYGFQNSVAHGFGSISLTTHFFINNNAVLRLGAGYGANVKSHSETDVNVLKLVTPKNYETYAGWIGLSRQFEISEGFVLAFNADYSYAFKTFNAMPTTATGVHSLIFGSELTSRGLPVTIGLNFNYVNSGNAKSMVSNVTHSVFRTWDVFCLIELPTWKKDNWKDKFSGSKRYSASISFGPNVIFLEKELANETDIADRFIPGVSIRIKLGLRFKTKIT